MGASVTPALLSTHLNYARWASARLVTAAEQLSSEELNRDFGSAYHSILGTLVHVYAADRVWFGRIQGNPPGRFMDPEQDMHLHVLQSAWMTLLKRWQEWSRSVDENSVAKKIAYRDLKGNEYETPLWQIILHVVNHGTHHRGQVSGFLRALGHTPPPLDLIAYYRQPDSQRAS